MLGRVPGSLYDADGDILDLEGIAFAHGDMREGAFRLLRRVDDRPGLLREIDVARDEIGVEVGLQDMGDLHAQSLRRLYVDIDVALRIYHRAGLLPGEDVRAVGYLGQKEVFDEHGSPPLCRPLLSKIRYTNNKYINPTAIAMNITLINPPARR